jgi:hypothetical protein
MKADNFDLESWRSQRRVGVGLGFAVKTVVEILHQKLGKWEVGAR